MVGLHSLINSEIDVYSTNIYGIKVRDRPDHGLSH